MKKIFLLGALWCAMAATTTAQVRLIVNKTNTKITEAMYLYNGTDKLALSFCIIDGAISLGFQVTTDKHFDLTKQDYVVFSGVRTTQINLLSNTLATINSSQQYEVLNHIPFTPTTFKAFNVFAITDIDFYLQPLEADPKYHLWHFELTSADRTRLFELMHAIDMP